MHRFDDYLRTLRSGRRFLSAEDERRLMRVGVDSFGLSVGDAQAAILNRALADGLIRQADIEDPLGFMLQERAGPRRRIGRGEFDRLAAVYRQQAGNTIGEAEARSRMRELAMRNGVGPSRSGPFLGRGWFTRIPPPAEGSMIAPPPPVPAVDPGAGVLARPFQGAGQPVGPAADPAGVLQLWAETLATRDAAAVAALYAPNALLLATAQRQPMVGPGQIQGYFQTLAANPGLTVRFEQELQRLDGPRTVISGTYAFFWLDAGTGQPVDTPARYSFVIGPAVPGATGRILLHHSSRLPGPMPDSPFI